MRVVLDCNVVIAAARTDGVCRSVLIQVVRAHELMVSAPILEEYRSVGARPKHRPYHRTMLAISDLVERVAVHVEAPLDRRFVLDDPDDEIYLATALAGRAEILITGDLRHFPERHYGPIAILGPAEFLARHGR